MKQISIISSFFLLLFSICLNAQNNTIPPDQLYGQLFKDIQLLHLFKDGKTFVDCTPKRSVKDIMADYKKQFGTQKEQNIFNNQTTAQKAALEKFVTANFEMPVNPNTGYQSAQGEDVVTHIKKLWKVLKRNPDQEVEGSSLLALPYPYIVPGGRFREIYYWDSYFTMLGLEESGEIDMIENMINNFSYLIATYGHIPNGNRNYYLTRSQPPFFSLMVELLAKHKGEAVFATYQNALSKEYAYWMDKTAATKHVVQMPDGSKLNRYYDAGLIPRQESFAEDAALVSKLSGEKNTQLSRNLRSGAETGWDFSTRWFADGKTIATIQTINLIPVDLNCLLYKLEKTLQKSYEQTGNLLQSNVYKQLAESRAKAIQKYCYSNTQNWYFDYNIATKRLSNEQTLAGMFPLFFQLVPTKNVNGISQVLKDKFLKNGGFVTTLKTSGQQWDAPNGWAPLQWITIKGLENYDIKPLAKEGAERWINLNEKTYLKTGKLMEKYNVVNTQLEAGGGEYPGQDGFGWTNGVLLKLISIYRK